MQQEYTGPYVNELPIDQINFVNRTFMVMNVKESLEEQLWQIASLYTLARRNNKLPIYAQENRPEKLLSSIAGSEEGKLQ